MAPYCAIPRDYLSDTPLLHAMGVFGVSTWPIGCDNPPFLSISPFSGGYGSASLLEYLGRLGAQPNTSAPATSHSEGGQDVAPPYQTDPPQVMSPNQSQTLPQDPAQVQIPPQVSPHDHPVEHRCKKEEASETKPEQEMFEVKEEYRGRSD